MGESHGQRTAAAAGLVLALGLPILRLNLLLGLDRRVGALLAFEAIWWGLAALVLAWVARRKRIERDEASPDRGRASPSRSGFTTGG